MKAAGGPMTLCLLAEGLFPLLREVDCLPETLRGACAAMFIVAATLLWAAWGVVSARSPGPPRREGWRRHRWWLAGNLALLGLCLALRLYGPLLLAAALQVVLYYGVFGGIDRFRR
jgi:hypothetical protein